MTQTSISRWITINPEDTGTWPPPFKMRIEATIEHPGFPDGEFHFFAVRENPRQVTNLGTKKKIGIKSIKRWRRINEINTNGN